MQNPEKMQNQFYKPENRIQFPSTLSIKESLPPRSQTSRPQIFIKTKKNCDCLKVENFPLKRI